MLTPDYKPWVGRLVEMRIRKSKDKKEPCPYPHVVVLYNFVALLVSQFHLKLTFVFFIVFESFKLVGKSAACLTYG